MDLQLTGKRALVTGATAGIGEAIGRMLAAEGAVVAVNGRSPAKIAPVVEAIRAAGGTAVGALGDLETEEGRASAQADVERELGGLDILVNNLGGPFVPGMRPWTSIPLGDWLGAYNKNTGAAVALINHFLPTMTAQGWGRIINVSTIAALEPTVGMPEYGAAKAALNNLTKSLSKAIAKSGVTVNIVTPGVVLTGTTQDWIESVAKDRGWDGGPEDWQKRYATEIRPIATNGIGGPDELAYIVTVLASPRSWYVTGANIRVDGGAVVGL